MVFSNMMVYYKVYNLVKNVFTFKFFQTHVCHVKIKNETWNDSKHWINLNIKAWTARLLHQGKDPTAHVSILSFCNMEAAYVLSLSDFTLPDIDMQTNISKYNFFLLCSNLFSGFWLLRKSEWISAWLI